MLKSCLEDLWRYEGRRCHSLIIQLRYFIFTPAFRYTYFLRHAKQATNPLTKLYWRFRLLRCSHKYGFQIPFTTKIGRGFRLAHFGHIVVNPSAEIGKDCTLAQGVLIGNAEGKKAGAPVIGDRCHIAANVTIIGGVKVGDDVLFAPGAFCNFDLPSNSIVIGNPGKIITREASPTRKYIVYSIDDFE